MIHVKDLPEPDDFYPVRRALLSVYDKTGIVELGTVLHQHGVELISTGGTATALAGGGLPVTTVESITGYPEILEGRVKTLHPLIHGALLARKTDPADLGRLDGLGTSPIDLVVVNLYPFREVVSREGVSDAEAIENIDIGGPTMIRAAAKNFFFTAVVTAVTDYDGIVAEMNANNGALSMSTRRDLSHKAFAHTARYDAAVDAYFSQAVDHVKETMTDTLTIHAGRIQSLRYGENPHQQAALYGDIDRFIEKLHGKELSFNNLLDLSAALFLIDEFRDHGPTCAILKHTNPCGVATADTLHTAYERAFATDRQSPFGGIVIVNRMLDIETATAIDGVFTELIIAPSFAGGVLDFLMQKKNRRLILHKRSTRFSIAHDIRSVIGGYLVQQRDPVLPDAEGLRDRCRVVTRREPSDTEWVDLDFAWRVAKHVKSNAIVYVKDCRTIGIGAGQMSRIDSSEVAVRKGAKSDLDFSDSVIASDAFFPFADGLVEAIRVGARAAVEPGGSIRDEDVIRAADEHGVAMIFTGQRHFRH